MYWASRRVSERRASALQRWRRKRPPTPPSRLPPARSRGWLPTTPTTFPLYTDQGRWKHGKETWTNWCEGFLGGQMWLFYESGLGDDWRSRAEHYSKLVEERQYDDQVHDLGFVLCPTWKKWWELTGDDTRRQVVIQGGQTMATRFNSKGRFLRSFLAPDSIFIDIMMNVGIIAVAGLETEDQQLLDVAEQHCETTRKYLVRGDGSVSHEGIFDLDTGEFLRQTTQQGWRDDSSWARGLAWSLYGFTSMYALTGNPHWLATAQLNADYWLEHTAGRTRCRRTTSTSRIPIRRWESSAAACAAGGLIMLASFVADDDRPSATTPTRGHHRSAVRAGVRRPRGHLGGRTQARLVPRDQAAGRRRERDVGRVLLRRNPCPGGAGTVNTTMRRPPLGDRLTTGRVIAVLRASHVSALAPVCDVLAEEGILSLELTLTTPDLLGLPIRPRQPLPGHGRCWCRHHPHRVGRRTCHRMRRAVPGHSDHEPAGGQARRRTPGCGISRRADSD